MKHSRIVASCACVLALLTSLLWGASARAADRTYHFDIPAEALSQALRSFGQTAGEQIIFTEDLVSGLTFSGLRGDFSAEAALQRLLQGTGLVAERTPAGVIMIRRIARSTKGDDQKNSPTAVQPSSSGVPVAQVDQGQTSSSTSVEQESDQASKKTISALTAKETSAVTRFQRPRGGPPRAVLCDSTDHTATARKTSATRMSVVAT